MRGHLLFALAPVSALVVAACAQASSDGVAGGDPKFDTTPQAPPVAPVPEGGVDAGAGTTFTDLYRDFFGPTGAARCAGGASSCHGAANHSGGNILVCGADKAECRTGIAGLAAGGDFKASALFDVLRKSPASGQNRMPKAPATFTFDEATMNRIADWAAAGAKDD